MSRRWKEYMRRQTREIGKGGGVGWVIKGLFVWPDSDAQANAKRDALFPPEA